MGQFMVDFIDDVLVYSKNILEHESYLRPMFQQLHDETRLYANKGKKFLCMVEVEYLGHIVSTQGISMDPKKVSVILAWPVPENITALRSFLGLSGFYRRFIGRYSQIAAPLTDLLQDKVPYVWTSLQQQSFEALKQAVSTAPILKVVNLKKSFILETNANGVAVGVVLGRDG